MWRDSGTTVSSGYLLTGNIRFHIEANKLFKYVNVSTQPLTGSVRVSRVLPSGVESTVAQYGEQGLTFSPDVLMYDPPTEYCAYRFTLTPDANGNSPIFNAYQVKALPAQRRQRMINLTVSCFDKEQTTGGSIWE